MKDYMRSMDFPKLPQGLLPLAPITIVAGHYGVGKTNFALNLAHDAKNLGKQITVIDLDIVNPYFRSSDYAASLESKGIRVIAPTYAGSTLDVPSLSGAIYPALERADEDNLVIVDVGGDDVGATALGRFVGTIITQSYRMIYVINAYRNLTQTPDEAADLLRGIEEKAGLQASGLVNNSHLRGETDISTVENSLDYAEAVASLVDLPLLATTVSVGAFDAGFPDDKKASSTDLAEEGNASRSSVLLSTRRIQNPYFVQVYVRTPWEL